MKKIVKKIFFFSGFFILLFSHNSAFAQFPVHLGGFKLGDDIKNYYHLVNKGTCREIPFNEYLKEGKIISRPEFKSGVITYGACDRPGKIIKIKLKFANSSEKFFKKLLKRYKKQLGTPDEYRGDPFKILIAWKWSFVNEQKERISLILQHNEMNEDDKIGTAVKLTLISQIEKERACFMDRFPDKKKESIKPELTGQALWDLLIPY